MNKPLISSMTLLAVFLSLLTACSTEHRAADETQIRADIKEADEEIVVTGSKILQPVDIATEVAHSAQPQVKYKRFAGEGFPRYELVPMRPPENNENYRHRDENSFKVVSEHPVSTFSIDVDSASYANARRFLNNGTLPDTDAIRSEEFINYFDYHYPSPEKSSTPFSITTEVAPSPWAEGRHLLHVGLKGYEVDNRDLPPANLVFLVDVSGSMNSANKLGLLKTSLKLLSKSLRKQDSVSIVVYAGASGVVLEPTSGSDTRKIETALNKLNAGGSTNGGAGIQLAYNIAAESFEKDGINRVILATDGDFNVGVTDIEDLKQLVKKQRDSGIELTTLGFGTGNYNDALMNELAEIGNGNAAYIDTALEARKALVEELSATLFTIAKDVKIQIEFSPLVAEYRLIGYESRLLNREDFNNDKIDAGEIGAGHTVTALYEIVLVDSKARTVDALRYDHGQRSRPKTDANELAWLKLRYKLPEQTKSTLVEQPIKRQQITDLKNTSESFRWSAAAAAFAQQLAGSNWIQEYGYQDVLKLAKSAEGDDRHGYRAEMIRLVKIADTLAMANSLPPAQQLSGEPGLRTQ